MSLIPDNHPLWKEWEGQCITVLTAENNWTSGTLTLIDENMIQLVQDEPKWHRFHFLRRDQVLKVSLLVKVSDE